MSLPRPPGAHRPVSELGGPSPAGHDLRLDENLFPPNAAQVLQEGLNDSEPDGSEDLFTMYLNLAEEEDQKMVESWKGDAEGMLVFTGLFSAAVAALLVVTIQDIRPSSQDTSAFYLATISQQLAQLNGTKTSVPSSLSNPAVSFTAPTWAVCVNALWFLSLVISITCAVLATLLQQWARRYLREAYTRYRPHMRARVRAFYRKGVEELHLPQVVEGLPALLHVSLFLFFAGLLVFLFSVNYTIFKAVIAWVALCVIVYAYLTVAPIQHKNSPYFTPLSTSVFACLTGIRSGYFQLTKRLLLFIEPFITHHPWANRILTGVDLHSSRVFPISFSMARTARHFAHSLGAEIDYESLMWMFDSLDQDQELEQFFAGIPRLCDSNEVPNAQLGVIKRHERKFSSVLIDFMNRTLSSDLISESVKRRRIIICIKVVDVTSLLEPWWILRRVLLGDWQMFLGCIEFGLFVKNWKSITHAVTLFYAECVAAIAISSIPEHDDRWLQLARSSLDAPKRIFLHNHSTNGDNILLANTISIVRRTIQTYSESPERHRSDILGASTKTLASLRKLDIRQTLPEMQHEFCGVWNQLVDLAKNDQREYIVCVAMTMLKNIRRLYIVLHEGTNAYPTAFSGATDDAASVLDNPNSYSQCSLAQHDPGEDVPELQIKEPAQEVTGSGLPTPAITPRTNPAQQSHSGHPPTDSLASVPQRQTTARVPHLHQLAHVPHSSPLAPQVRHSHQPSQPSQVPHSRQPTQVPHFHQPTHYSASHLQPQAHFGHPTPPFVGPPSTVPQTGPTSPRDVE